jgi:predicted phosphodiesterase
MRMAIVSDMHGNRTAFEAVLADLKQTSPDLILHGGDLADSGASPAEIVDRIRELGWEGVVGNTDEMLFAPESLQEFAKHSAGLQPVVAVVEEIAAATRESLGDARLAWLRELPRVQTHGPMILVHASPESLWHAPSPEAGDADLELALGSLDTPISVYGPIHCAYVRNLPQRIVANIGSVSLSYDGDRRAAYLLLDDGNPSIRRVVYDLDKELKALASCRLPHTEWLAKTLQMARPQMPAAMPSN